MGEVIPGRWRTDTADTVRMYEVNAPGAPSQDFIAREEYLGRHRARQPRTFSLRRLFYVARHRRR